MSRILCGGLVALVLATGCGREETPVERPPAATQPAMESLEREIMIGDIVVKLDYELERENAFSEGVLDEISGGYGISTNGVIRVGLYGEGGQKLFHGDFTKSLFDLEQNLPEGEIVGIQGRRVYSLGNNFNVQDFRKIIESTSLLSEVTKIYIEHYVHCSFPEGKPPSEYTYYFSFPFIDSKNRKLILQYNMGMINGILIAPVILDIDNKKIEQIGITWTVYQY